MMIILLIAHARLTQLASVTDSAAVTALLGFLLLHLHHHLHHRHNYHLNHHHHHHWHQEQQHCSKKQKHQNHHHWLKWLVPWISLSSTVMILLQYQHQQQHHHQHCQLTNRPIFIIHAIALPYVQKTGWRPGGVENFWNKMYIGGVAASDDKGLLALLSLPSSIPLCRETLETAWLQPTSFNLSCLMPCQAPRLQTSGDGGCYGGRLKPGHVI